MGVAVDDATRERICAEIVGRVKFFRSSFSHFHQDYPLSAIFLSLISPSRLSLIMCVFVILEVTSVEGIVAEFQDRW